MTTTLQRRIAPLLRGALMTAVVLLTGCARGQYPVTGKVTYEDGSPVTGGATVVFEGTIGDRLEMARGKIQPDGSYQLGTLKPGDGAYAGTYQVRIIPPDPDADISDSRGPEFDKRYTQFETSGLTYEVTSGRNEFPITISKPSKK